MLRAKEILARYCLLAGETAERKLPKGRHRANVKRVAEIRRTALRATLNYRSPLRLSPPSLRCSRRRVFPDVPQRVHDCFSACTECRVYVSVLLSAHTHTPGLASSGSACIKCNRTSNARARASRCFRGAFLFPKYMRRLFMERRCLSCSTWTVAQTIFAGYAASSE